MNRVVNFLQKYFAVVSVLIGISNPGYFTDIADKYISALNSFATDSWKTIS